MSSDYGRPEDSLSTGIQSVVREKETSGFLFENGTTSISGNEAQEMGKRGYNYSTLDTYRELIHALAAHHISSERLCQIANNISLKT